MDDCCIAIYINKIGKVHCSEYTDTSEVFFMARPGQ